MSYDEAYDSLLELINTPKGGGSMEYIEILEDCVAKGIERIAYEDELYSLPKEEILKIFQKSDNNNIELLCYIIFRT